MLCSGRLTMLSRARKTSTTERPTGRRAAGSCSDTIACSTSNNALPQAVLDKLPKIETHEHDPIEAAERIIAGMPNPPELQHAGSKAFYSPITDRITLPPRELFASVEEYYATAFHETIHSTGSEKRLAREGICEVAPFGSAVYSKEELCAEMGAAYLCAEAGITAAVIENQAAYVAGWLKKLRDDRKLLIHAATQAQHAADHILNRTCHE